MAKIPGLPQMGDDARSVMPVQENASVSPTEREGKPLTKELSDGPKMGAKGEFLPARYVLPDREVTLPNGQSKLITGVICEDR